MAGWFRSLLKKGDDSPALTGFGENSCQCRTPIQTFRGMSGEWNSALGTAGEPGQARLQTGAERQLHSRREVDCLPFQHARADARLRG